MATKKVEKLAIDGGKKVWTKGFPAWPQFDRKTDKKVLDILHSGKVNYWTGTLVSPATWRLLGDGASSSGVTLRAAEKAYWINPVGTLLFFR